MEKWEGYGGPEMTKLTCLVDKLTVELFVWADFGREFDDTKWKQDFTEETEV